MRCQRVTQCAHADVLQAGSDGLLILQLAILARYVVP